MNIRAATDADLAPIFLALRAYSQIYQKNVGAERSADSYIDGRPQNIEDADWLHYEGTATWFPAGMLKEIMPWLVMTALVANDDCRWIVVDGSVAIQHRLVTVPITYKSLNDGTWLQVNNYDESPNHGEIALASFRDLMALFSRKRIHGASPLY